MALTLDEYYSSRLTTAFNDDGSYTHTIPCDLGPTGQQVRVETWKRVKEVGKGAFGTVWKEECTQGRTVRVRAVKQVQKSHIKTTELLALTKMSQYPQHFVQFFGWFQDEANIYLAMEYIECGDLETLLRDEELSESDIKSITAQLLDGLKVMHEHNICHRDLKPQNVLIVRWMPLKVKISDFGIAKESGDLTELRTFAGSPGYIAPEIWGYLDSDTSQYTNAVDIWSLGCLVHMMITKKTPFLGTKELLDYIQGTSTFLGTMLGMATEFITGLLMPLPQDRLTAEQARDHPWLGIRREVGQDITYWGDLSLVEILEESKLKPGITMSKPEQVKNVSAPKLETKLTPTEKREIKSILFLAVGNARVEIIKAMLDRGGDVMARDDGGFTLLHIAATHGHTEVAEFLLEKGADIMATAGEGHTSLHIAAQDGHIDMTRLLLQRGAEITATTISGYTALHQAASNGHIDTFLLLLGEGAELMGRTNEGYTVLNLAAGFGKVDLVQLLLDKGLDVMESSTKRYTSLHLAAQNGHSKVVKLLLENGANAMAVTTSGYTPAHQAANNGHMDVLVYLLKGGAEITATTDEGYTLLHMAASDGYLEIVRFLLEQGVDVLAKGGTGYTSLYLAAQNGHLEVLKPLLEYGADPMAASDSGYTPLHQAACNGHMDPLESLLQWGADITTTTKEGYTLLHMAAYSGHTEVVQFLLDQDVEIMAKCDIGHTPLHMAAQNGHLETVKLLLENGADAMDKDTTAYTPLHQAAKNGHIDVLETLLLRGGEITTRTSEGYTLLHMAASDGNTEMVQFLLAQGVDIMARSDMGYTPLHIAAQDGHTEVSRVLLENGADIAATTTRGNTPLKMAIANCGKADLVCLLLEWSTKVAQNIPHPMPSSLPAASRRTEAEELRFGTGILPSGDTRAVVVGKPAGKGGSVVGEEGPVVEGQEPSVREEGSAVVVKPVVGEGEVVIGPSIKPERLPDQPPTEGRKGKRLWTAMNSAKQCLIS